MELLQLQYFCAVAEECHVSNVAKKLHVSQSAVSHAVLRLEKELGYRLFDRQSGRIELNKAGHIFLEHVKNAMCELEEGEKRAAAVAEEKSRVISIRVDSGDRVIWNLIGAYKELNPGAEFALFTDGKAMAELVICTEGNAEAFNVIETQAVGERQLHALVSAHGALSSSPYLELNDFKDMDYLYYRPRTERKPSAEIDVTDGFRELSGWEPKICRVDTRFELWQEVIKEKGIALCFGEVERTAAIKVIPVGDPTYRQTLVMGTAKGSRLNSAQKEFFNFCVEHYKKQLQGS